MAVSNDEKQVLWATAATDSVAAGGNETSDVLTLGETAIGRAITLKALNGGTPAAGDLADDVRAKCSEEMEYIKSLQVEDLESYFDRWVAKPGIWK